MTGRGVEPKLRCLEVSKTFGDGSRRPVVAIEQLSLDVFPGEMVALVGPSGCGKSTLLAIIAGLETPTTGTVKLDGRVITGPGPDRGVCFQDYALFPWKSVKENVAFGLKVRGVSRDERERVTRHYIHLVSLVGFEDRYPHQLSGGMKQRCALARLFANDPEILLLDEPLASVDAQTRNILQEEILRIWGDARPAAERKTAIYVTHNIEEALFLADRVAVMTSRPGRIRSVIDNPLPRPRADAVRTDPVYVRLTAEIWAMLKDEARQAI